MESAEEKVVAVATRHCVPCEKDGTPLPDAEVERLLAGLPGWQLTGGAIWRRFEFKNYHQTMAFVNAVAWIAHSEGHHPDLEVSYGSCKVSYTTHAIGGLSENDFYCATRVEGLFA